jgi:hypothetical protein
MPAAALLSVAHIDVGSELTAQALMERPASKALTTGTGSEKPRGAGAAAAAKDFGQHGVTGRRRGRREESMTHGQTSDVRS